MPVPPIPILTTISPSTAVKDGRPCRWPRFSRGTSGGKYGNVVGSFDHQDVTMGRSSPRLIRGATTAE